MMTLILFLGLAHATDKIVLVGKVLGAGEVHYVGGRPVTTNRRLTRSYVKVGERAAVEHRRDPGAPVPFPPESHSSFKITRDDHGRLTLALVEFWDLSQAFETGGFLGEAGFSFDHHVPVEFTEGSWEDYEAGRPVRLRTTNEGAHFAADDLREIVGLSSIFRVRPRPGEAIRAETSAIEKHCAALLADVPEAERSRLLAELFEASHKENHDPANRYEVTGASPRLRIECVGTRDDMTVRYLDAATVEAVGYNRS